MILSAYLLLSWLAAALLVTVKKRLHKQELVFVLLFFITIHTQAYVVFDDPLRLFRVSDQPGLFSSYLLYRSVMAPLVLTLFIAMFDRGNKISRLVIGVVLMGLLDAWSASNQLFIYHRGNPFISVCYYALLLAAGLGALNGFKRMRM